MIADSSALIAILRDEPEKDAFVAALFRAGGGAISAGSWIEIAAVVRRRYSAIDPMQAEALRTTLKLSIVPVTVEQARIGADAYRAFGIGTGHPAKLNFGDCFSYALAKVTGEPLLFKGDDFSRTDLIRALA
jgi:ribonuclease VapC